MSRRAPRRIVVDGEVYRWSVRQFDSRWVVLTIWRTGLRTTWADVWVRFDDAWLLLGDRREEADRDDAHTLPLRPGLVAEIIRARRLDDVVRGEYVLAEGSEPLLSRRALGWNPGSLT